MDFQDQSAIQQSAGIPNAPKFTFRKLNLIHKNLHKFDKQLKPTQQKK